VGGRADRVVVTGLRETFVATIHRTVKGDPCRVDAARDAIAQALRSSSPIRSKSR